jgi:hypothetical protein
MIHQATVFADRIVELTGSGETLGAAVITCLPTHPRAKLIGENQIRFADGSRVTLTQSEEGQPCLFTSPPL